VIPNTAKTIAGSRPARRRESVIAHSGLLLLLVVCMGAPRLSAQVNCSTSKELICEFPVSAASLASVTVGAGQGNSGANPVASLAATNIAFPINEAFATQLTQLPVPSASVGVVSLRQPGSEVGVPFDNLGPILTDRPDTVGKEHLFLGFSYQHFNFNSISGTSLGTLPVAFSYTQPSPFNPADQQTVYGGLSNNASFTLDQYVGLLTFGATKSTDVSIIVPINSVTVGVASSKIQAYVFDSVKNQYSSVPPLVSSLATHGTAQGVGDITINVKQLISGQEGERVAVAAGGMLRAPSGDAGNYLGSGAMGEQVYGLIEYRYKIAPHLKVAYQWNGVSRDLTYQGFPKVRLPNGLQYDVGSDFRLARTLTADVDFLGNQFVNGSTVIPASLTLSPAPSASNSATNIPLTIATVDTPQHTFTTANFSFGAKWSPHPGYLVFFNILKNVNAVGLGSDVVPLVGIAYHR
jgi:hypothetical protein